MEPGTALTESESMAHLVKSPRTKKAMTTHHRAHAELLTLSLSRSQAQQSSKVRVQKDCFRQAKVSPPCMITYAIMTLLHCLGANTQAKAIYHGKTSFRNSVFRVKLLPHVFAAVLPTRLVLVSALRRCKCTHRFLTNRLTEAEAVGSCR